MNKNILILTIALFALIVSLGIVLLLSKNPASSPMSILKGVTTAAINKNVAELGRIDVDLALFAEDDIVSQELDAILNEVGEINEATINLTNDEENLNNLDNDLTSLSGDENINNEIDRSLQEISL